LFLEEEEEVCSEDVSGAQLNLIDRFRWEHAGSQSFAISNVTIIVMIVMIASSD
jgi:hypothetical protein